MAKSDDVLSLAKWLATSESINNQIEPDLVRLLTSQAEQTPNLAQPKALRTSQLGEALMLTFETADTLRRFKDALLPVAEAGGMTALVNAISLSSKGNADVGALNKALFQVMEGQTNPK